MAKVNREKVIASVNAERINQGYFFQSISRIFFVAHFHGEIIFQPEIKASKAAISIGPVQIIGSWEIGENLLPSCGIDDGGVIISPVKIRLIAYAKRRPDFMADSLDKRIFTFRGYHPKDAGGDAQSKRHLPRRIKSLVDRGIELSKRAVPAQRYFALVPGFIITY